MTGSEVSLRAHSPLTIATKCPSLLIWLSLAMELSERPPRARRRILLRVGLGRVGGLEMSASTEWVVGGDARELVMEEDLREQLAPRPGVCLW